MNLYELSFHLIFDGNRIKLYFMEKMLLVYCESLIIAFCAGILNVIPYIGSAITMVLAIILGVSACISTGAYEQIGSTIYTIFFTLLTIC